MNDFDSHNNEYDVNGADKQGSSSEQTAPIEQKTEQTPICYEYIFSNGCEQSMPKAQKKRCISKSVLIAVACIVICALVSFGAGFGGVIYANKLVKNDNDDTLHLDDPSAALQKAESEFSVYGSAGDEVLTVSQVANKVSDAIVVINATVYTSTIFGTSESTSAGSGVVISDTGYIVTCHHVVENAKNIQVSLTSGKVYEATLVGSDPLSDLAVLKITPEEALTAVKQGCSADLVVGEYVVAIGNPLGTLSGTVTSGIISATERSIAMTDGSEMTLLQTDAAINSGNSGGGLFNLQGELIGIVNAKYASSGVEGLAFAIPIDSAYEVQQDLIQYGYRRNIIDTGLETLDVTERDITVSKNYYAQFGISTAGVYVYSSEYTDELKNADRIISIDGVAVNTTEELNAEFKKHNVGDTVTIIASRAGAEFSVQMILREYIPDSVKLH